MWILLHSKMYNSSKVENTDDTDSQLKSAAGGLGGGVGGGGGGSDRGRTRQAVNDRQQGHPKVIRGQGTFHHFPYTHFYRPDFPPKDLPTWTEHTDLYKEVSRQQRTGTSFDPTRHAATWSTLWIRGAVVPLHMQRRDPHYESEVLWSRYTCSDVIHIMNQRCCGFTTHAAKWPRLWTRGAVIPLGMQQSD